MLGPRDIVESNLVRFIKMEHLVPRLACYKEDDWKMLDEAFFWSWKELRVQEKGVINDGKAGRISKDLEKNFLRYNGRMLESYEKETWLLGLQYLETLFAKFETHPRQIQSCLVYDILNQSGVYERSNSGLVSAMERAVRRAKALVF